VFLARLISTGLLASKCTGGRSIAGFRLDIPVREARLALCFEEGEGGELEFESVLYCLTGVVDSRVVTPDMMACGLTKAPSPTDGMLSMETE